MAFTHLLVPSDGSDRSRRAIAGALELAATLGARITFLHVHPSAPLPLSGFGANLDARTIEALIAASLEESERILAEASQQAETAGVPFSCESLAGDLPHRGILSTAERLGCDLIVMASHGRRGLPGLLVGSETQRVLSQAPCPVLVHR